MDIKKTYIGIEKPIPHTITEAAREALSEIPEKTDQELYFSQEETEEPEQESEQEEINPVFIEATDTTGKNPKELGWYEMNGQNEFVLTEDTESLEGKTYYIKQ